MNKLKLRLDDLHVDSFDITVPQKANGTVFGEQCTCYTQCTCPGCPTCDASCNGTCEAGTGCGPTCNISCQNSCVDYETCFRWTEVSCAYDTCTCGSGPRTAFC